jgi:hypothetical protein
MSEGLPDGSRARRVWLGVLATLVLAGLAGCASSAHSALPSPGSSARPSAATSSPGTAAANPPASPPASQAAVGAQNLVASSSVKAELLAAFAAEKGLPEDEVTGPLPGTLCLPISWLYGA